MDNDLPFLLTNIKSITEEEKEIHIAFKDFIYKETSWKMYFENGAYMGKTAERFKAFRAGFLKGKIK